MYQLCVGTWLSQQQEYEADVIGARLSVAAGCSRKAILHGSSCQLEYSRLGYLAEVSIMLHFWQIYMPDAQLPNSLHSSSDFLQVLGALAQHHRVHPDDKNVRVMLFDFLDAAYRHLPNSSLLVSLTSTHPQWPSRIANLLASNVWKKGSTKAEDMPCKQKLAKGQQLLKAFQDLHKMMVIARRGQSDLDTSLQTLVCLWRCIQARAGPQKRQVDPVCQQVAKQLVHSATWPREKTELGDK